MAKNLEKFSKEAKKMAAASDTPIVFASIGRHQDASGEDNQELPVAFAGIRPEHNVEVSQATGGEGGGGGQ